MTDDVSFTALMKQNMLDVVGTDQQKVYKKKNNTDKALQKEVHCPASVKISTYGNAYTAIDGKEVVLFNGIPYYSCTRPPYEKHEFCWRHAKVKDCLQFNNLISDGGEVLTKEHSYFDKYRSKLNNVPSKQKDKYTVEVPKELIQEVEALIAKFNESSNTSSNISTVGNAQDIVESKSKANLTTEEYVPEEVSDVEEVDDHNGEANTIITELMNKSDELNKMEDSDSSEENDCSDSDDSLTEMEELKTKSEYGARSFGLNIVNDPPGGKEMIYNVYDLDGEQQGKLIKVNDKHAPFLYEGSDYIAGVDMDQDGECYLHCAISNRIYDSDSKEYAGKYTKRSNGKMNIKFLSSYLKNKK
jgi:hypothetical protein